MKIISYTNKFPLIHKNLFETVGKIFNLEFTKNSLENQKKTDAWLLCDNDINDYSINSLRSSPCSCFQIINKEMLLPAGDNSAIEFSSSPYLPLFLQNRKISAKEISNLKCLPNKLSKNNVLASKDGEPIWVVNDKDGYIHHYVSLQLPEFKKEKPLFHYFNRNNFISLLPFIMFVKNLVVDSQWEPPPLRASFMFDDPNLHWRTYGFIDFYKMLQNAISYNYHVSFATIPLDSYFYHLPTVKLFKNNSKKISLLIHGNDHLSYELGRFCKKEEINKSLLKALKRIDNYEHKSGLKVSRVMAPPHGACNEIAIQEMANLGFDSVCVSRWSLESYNKNAEWINTIGMKPSDEVSSLTVLPRFKLEHDCQNSIIIAALLNQPIIPVGHHEDLKNGLDILRNIADFINSFGYVHWSNMETITRTNYLKRISLERFSVKMLSNRISLDIPNGIDEVCIQKENSPILQWRCTYSNSEWKLLLPGEVIKNNLFRNIEVRALPLQDKHSELINREFSIWPLLRRIITESRDRLSPAINLLSPSGIWRKTLAFRRRLQ